MTVKLVKQYPLFIICSMQENLMNYIFHSRFRMFRSTGVNRVSIGIQVSFKYSLASLIYLIDINSIYKDLDSLNILLCKVFYPFW